MCKRFDLSGKVAVVTGASRGIGARLAQALDEAGCRVALVARTTEGLEQVASTMANDPIVVTADVGDPEVPARVVAEGGHVRVVLEDAPFDSPHGNVEWVEAAAQAIDTAGAALASADDLRGVLAAAEMGDA